MSNTVEPCGCKHDGRQWLATCAPCEATWQELHARAQRDLKRSVAAPVPKPQPDWLELPQESAA